MNAMYMRKITFSNALAILAILSGAGLVVFGFLMPLISVLINNPDILDILFIVFWVSLITAIPGFFFLYNGVHLLKHKENRFIKGTVGTFVVIGALVLHIFFSAYIRESLSGVQLPFLFTTLIAIPVYVILSKFFIKREGLTWRKGEFIGWGLVLLISWEMFFAGMEITRYFFPLSFKPDRNNAGAMLGMFLSTAIPILFYKVVTRRIDRLHKEYLIETYGDNAVLLGEGNQPHEEN